MNFKPTLIPSSPGVGNIVRSFQEMQSNRQISSLTEAAIDRHMVGKGDIVTREMITNVAKWDGVRVRHLSTESTIKKTPLIQEKNLTHHSRRTARYAPVG